MAIVCCKWQAARQALETRLADLAMAKRAVEGEVRWDGDRERPEEDLEEIGRTDDHGYT